MLAPTRRGFDLAVFWVIDLKILKTNLWVLIIYTRAVHNIPEWWFEFCFYSDSGGCLLQGLIFIDGQKVPNPFYTENPLLQPHPSNWRGDYIYIIYIYMDIYIYIYTYDQDSVHSKGMSQTSKRLLSQLRQLRGSKEARHDRTMDMGDVMDHPVVYPLVN